MRILVTGAAGFIGSNLVAALNERGETDIAVCDRLGKDERWLNLRKRMFRDFVFPEDLPAFLERRGDVTAILLPGFQQLIGGPEIQTHAKSVDEG